MRIGLGLGLIAVLVGAVWFIDQEIRSRTLSQLTSAVEASQAQMNGYLDDADQVNAEWLSAVRKAGQETSETSTFYVNGKKEAASTRYVDVRIIGDQIDELSVLPWHGSIEEVRAKYLEHSMAWSEFLSEMSSVTSIGDYYLTLDKHYAEIEATWRMSRDSLKKVASTAMDGSVPSLIERTYDYDLSENGQ